MAIIWFSSLSVKNKDSDASKLAPSNAQLNDNLTAAASLPISKSAFLEPVVQNYPPIRKWGVEEPLISAKSVYAIELNSGKTLIEKDPLTIRPIASLAKLMTALLIVERANLQDIITISQNAVKTYGKTGGLIVNEKLSIESLLYIMLIESSNDAATALAESTAGRESQFIDQMNQKANELGLINTFFSDPHGLDQNTRSNAKDLARLTEEIIKNPLLKKIATTQEIKIDSVDKKQHHILINSNHLLKKYPEIIAGKTGFTDEAGQCMVLALNAPGNHGIIINVILDSQDRIGEMDKLIQWEKEAFVW